MRSKILPSFIVIAGLFGQPLVAQSTDDNTLVGNQSRNALFKSAEDLSLGRFAQTDDTLELIRDEELRGLLQSGGFSVSSQDGGVMRAEMTAENLELPKRQQDFLSEAGLPTTLGSANLLANLDLEKGGLEGDKLRGVDLQKFDIALGDIEISGSGKMELDSSEKMQGQANVTIVQWRSLLAAMDLPDEGLRSQIEEAVSGFADGNSVNLTLNIRDNSLMLGPLKLTTLSAF